MTRGKKALIAQSPGSAEIAAGHHAAAGMAIDGVHRRQQTSTGIEQAAHELHRAARRADPKGRVERHRHEAGTAIGRAGEAFLVRDHDAAGEG